MSKGKSEIEDLKQPFNAFLGTNIPKVTVELVETSRKKKGSDEIKETEFVAVRLPHKRSEIGDELGCDAKNVTSLLGSASKNLNRSSKMKARIIELADLDETDAELVKTHPDVRLSCEDDSRGRGTSDWMDF